MGAERAKTGHQKQNRRREIPPAMKLVRHSIPTKNEDTKYQYIYLRFRKAVD